MTLIGLAARNTWRNPLRTGLTVLAVAVTVMAFLLLRTVVDTWGMAGDIAAKDRIATRHKLSFAIPLPRHYVDKIRSLPEVEHATWTSWFGGKDLRHPELFFASFAVDPRSFVEVFDELALSPEEKRRWFEDRQGAIVGFQLARQLNLKVGDRLPLSGTMYPGDWTLNVSAIFTPSRKSFDPNALLLHYDLVDQSLPEASRNTVGWVTSRVRSANQGVATANAIDRSFAGHGHRTRTVSERDLNLSFVARFASLMKAVAAMSGVLLLILGLLLANTLSMGVRERTVEYGALRALGFSTRHLHLLIVGEALVLSLLSGATGVFAGSSLINGFLSHVVEDNAGGMFPFFRLSSGTMWGGLALALLLGLLASLIPARSVARMPVANALRRVE